MVCCNINSKVVLVMKLKYAKPPVEVLEGQSKQHKFYTIFYQENATQCVEAM